MHHPADEEEEAVEVEVVDALPAVVDDRALVAAPLAAPVVHTVAAAATGFLAGAAALALLRRRDARRVARELLELRERVATPARPARAAFPLEPGRSYLLHVRVLSRPPHVPPPG